MATYQEIKSKQFDFHAHGGFFAFGNDQFKENKIGNEPFVKLGMGLYCSKEKVENLLKELNTHSENQKKEIREKCTFEEILKYEWSNYECDYTGDGEEATKILLSYYTEEEIRKFLSGKTSGQAREIKRCLVYLRDGGNW
jgi:hypothetical protein